MPVQNVTPILNVSSITESIAWFAKLGWRQGFVWCDQGHKEPSFGSVCSEKAEIFLCRGGQGSRGAVMPKFPGDDAIDGVWMSWWMASPAEVDALHQTALGLGMTVTYPPTNEPWDVREFHLRHPDGHTFRVSAGLSETEE